MQAQLSVNESPSLRLSLLSSAAVAAFVGYGSSIAILLAAAAALQATPAQTASWLLAICLAKATGSALLSTWTRIPVVLAWSTPGAALIASSSGLSMSQAVGAFLFAALLLVLTGVLRPLGTLVGRLPPAIAAGMLAGVLLPFCLAVPPAAQRDPGLVLPIVAVFVVVRLWNSAFAVLAALAAGLALALWQGAALPSTPFPAPAFVFIPPEFDPAVLLGLGLPLYLVTMASQNLPGFAVLHSAGYRPPVAKALGVTGLLSGVAALFGAHSVNMAAITAAICLSDDVHPDRAQRWKVGLAYAGVWICLGLFGPLILAGIAAMPTALILSIAGLALIGPLVGALSSAFADPAQRFTAAVTVLTAASGVSAAGIGAAFWGLLAGLAVYTLDRLRARSRDA